MPQLLTRRLAATTVLVAVAIATVVLVVASHDRVALPVILYPPVTLAALLFLERTTSIGLDARMRRPQP